MKVPVHPELGPIQVVVLPFTLAGVVLAMRP
jgi:hypothetical protein